MTTYVPVTPGIDMSAAMRRDGARRLTKKWLREYLKANPQKDFRNEDLHGGTYVNGGDAVQGDLTLQVMDPATMSTVAMVVFQTTDTNEWGYQAVVR